MIRTAFALIMGTLFLGSWAATASASVCPSYEQVQNSLERTYGEKKIFGGFADDDDHSATAIYEFWANPELGSWSLVAQKLIQFQYGSQTSTRHCTFVINSGIQHVLMTATDDFKPTTTTESTASRSAPRHPGCVPRSSFAHSLETDYQEAPILYALASDGALVEVYGGKKSWTIFRSQVKGLTQPRAGEPLTDPNTAQEIRQLCFTASFSGKSWGVFPIMEMFY